MKPNHEEIGIGAADRVEVEANRAYIRSALTEAEWTAAQSRGKTMRLEQALAFASES